jgi:hypothetical protein
MLIKNKRAILKALQPFLLFNLVFLISYNLFAAWDSLELLLKEGVLPDIDALYNKNSLVAGVIIGISLAAKKYREAKREAKSALNS